MLVAKTRRCELSPRTFIVGLCLSAIATSSTAQERTLATMTDASVQARAVLKADRQVVIRLGAPGQEARRELPLGPAVQSVVKLVASPSRQRIGVIGDTGGEYILEVSVVDVSSASIVSAVTAFAPAVSPSGRFIIYEPSRPRHSTANAGYNVIDLDGAATAPGLTPMRVYPSDDLPHARKSQFYWLGPNIVAFLDQAAADSRVVVVRLNADGKVDDVVIKPLDLDRLVNAADVDSNAPPASALYNPTITRLDGDGLTVRLKFPAEPALKARRVDVRIW